MTPQEINQYLSGIVLLKGRGVKTYIGFHNTETDQWEVYTLDSLYHGREPYELYVRDYKEVFRWNIVLLDLRKYDNAQIATPRMGGFRIIEPSTRKVIDII